jgi:hypothetical protein
LILFGSCRGYFFGGGFFYMTVIFRLKNAWWGWFVLFLLGAALCAGYLAQPKVILE